MRLRRLIARVGIARLREHGAGVPQPLEAIGEAAGVSLEIVRAHLIDDDQNDQTWSF